MVTQPHCCLSLESPVQAAVDRRAWQQYSPEFLVDDFISPGPLTLFDLFNIDQRFRAGPPMWTYGGQTPLTREKRAVFHDVVVRLYQQMPAQILVDLGLAVDHNISSGAMEVRKRDDVVGTEDGAGVLIYTYGSIDSVGGN